MLSTLTIEASVVELRLVRHMQISGYLLDLFQICVKKEKLANQGEVENYLLKLCKFAT